MNHQQKIERQVAAMHRAIADRLRSGDLSPMERAVANLERWRLQFGGTLPPAYLEWQTLIAAGLECVLEVLESDHERAIQRRSSSPFTGVLTPQERWQILRDAA